MLANSQASTGNIEALGLSRKNRRLYVGNLPMGLVEAQTVQFFNLAARNMGVAAIPGDPVTSMWIAPDGKYGFLEFRSSNECTSALTMNGLTLNGRQLVMKRPNDWEPDPVVEPVAGSALNMVAKKHIPGASALSFLSKEELLGLK